MSAANFHNVNASKIYAVNLEHDDSFQDLQEDLSQALGELNGLNGYSWEPGDDKDPHELRSYPSRVLGRLSNSKLYKDYEVEIHIIPVIRSAYYDGCNLDWYCRYFVAHDEVYLDDPKYMVDIIESEADVTTAEACRRARFIVKWFEKAKTGLIAQIEKVFETYATQKLVHVSTFSNGEAVYQEVK